MFTVGNTWDVALVRVGLMDLLVLWVIDSSRAQLIAVAL